MKSKDKESNCSSQYITSSLFSTEVDFIIVRDAESKKYESENMGTAQRKFTGKTEKIF